MYYVEHCDKVYNRSGNMLPVPAIKLLTGFRSVYGFSKEDAQEIQEQHASRGFSKYEVYSDTWVMDFDNNEQGMRDTLAWVKSKNLSYKLYESGGKGHHIEVPTTEMYDHNLPFYHKEMAKKLNTGADLSIYRHSSLYRLPNTVHDKTGRLKLLLEEGEGEFLLEVPTCEVPKNLFNVTPLSGYQELKWALRSIQFGIEECPGSGNRHALLWRTAADFCKAGISFDTALELLLFMNRSWNEEAKPDTEVQRSCSEGYKYISGTNKS